jgi:hypothetical protein
MWLYVLGTWSSGQTNAMQMDGKWLDCLDMLKVVESYAFGSFQGLMLYGRCKLVTSVVLGIELFR